jgi:hypothetical protein
MRELRPVSLFFVPNERSGGLQVGPRLAFQELQRSGRISRLEIESLLDGADRVGPEAACRNLIERVGNMQPDIIFWQHAAQQKIDVQFLTKLKSSSPRSLLVYHEGDVYSQVYNRLPVATQLFIRHADAVFLVGLGPLQRLVEKAGARRIFWAPHVFDEQRFGQPPTQELARQRSAIMIGNLVKFGGFLPPFSFLSRYPGSAERFALARRLSKLLGDDFVIFGKGWPKLSACRGPLPFADQCKAIQQSWVSVNWDYFAGHSYYFSDRLPIALAAGVPHVTTYHSGYDTILRGCEGVVLVKSVQEAVDGVLYILSMTRERNAELGASCREFARKHFEARAVFTNIFQKCLELLESRNMNLSGKESSLEVVGSQ